MYLHRWLSILGAALFVTACSNASSVPTTSFPAMNVLAAPKPLTKSKSYGTGLNVSAALFAGSSQWSKQYCATHSSSNCGGVVQHQKEHGFSASHAGHDKQYGGTFTLSTSEDSSMGSSSYGFNLTADGTVYTPGQDGAGVSGGFAWTDNLHIKSKHLAKGTPVTINVELSVTPGTTDVDCTSDDNSIASVSDVASGTDKYGTTLQVGGGCANPGDFEYVVGANSAGGVGTTDTGVLTASVGDTVGIYGAGSYQGWACTFTFSCYGSYTTDLSGTFTWKITSVSPNGVTITTDSGRKY